ncbi:hypothetical protein JYT11_01035, partial [Planctomycetaceae bacterium AH-315-I19]|nr:hypothetical protein [Planctomycetaceae bacterium AH-315-I19]
MDKVFVYDAWNRLVKVSISSSSQSQQLAFQERAEFTYYPGNQRATSLLETDRDAQHGPDECNHFYYDDSFTGSRGDHGTSFGLDRVQQYIWGHRYVDELACVQEAPDDQGFAGHDASFALNDRNFSVIALAEVDGDSFERIRYTAYGRPFTEPFGDVDGNGRREFNDVVSTTTSIGDMPGASGNYKVDADVNFDGIVDSANDLALVSGSPAVNAGMDVLSTMDYLSGYTGHLYETEVGLTLGRMRWLDSTLGRWVTRDPAGYVDGGNLYQYASSRGMSLLDPSGLKGQNVLGTGADSVFFELSGSGSFSLPVAGIFTLGIQGSYGHQVHVNC